MGLTVYISNKEIQAVIGNANGTKVKADSFYRCETPEGSILNGVITDPQMLTDAIKDFWEKEKLPKKRAELIINSSQLLGRVTTCPLLNVPKTVTLLEHEFAEADKQDQTIVGFTRLESDKTAKTSRIFAEVTTFDYITAYDQIFADAGVTLSGISSGIGKMVGLLENTDILADSITILMILDEVMLTTIFFLNKQYYYSTSTRVFAMRGTGEFAIEIAGVVSRLNQFSRSENIEGQIQSVMLSGFEKDEIEAVRASVAGLNIGDITCGEFAPPSSVKVADGDDTFRQMIFPIAGLIQSGESVNVLHRARKLAPEAVKKSHNFKLAIPYIILTSILFTGTIVLAVLNINRGAYLRELEAHNNDVTILQKAAAYDSELEAVHQLNAQLAATQLLTADIESYPALKKSVLELVRRKAAGLAEVKFVGYDASSGVLTMQATAEKVEDTSEFIKLLSAEDAFEYVNYTGYSFNETDQNWIINMVCALSESAGKE